LNIEASVSTVRFLQEKATLDIFEELFKSFKICRQYYPLETAV